MQVDETKITKLLFAIVLAYHKLLVTAHRNRWS